jgi:hypothetical protein
LAIWSTGQSPNSCPPKAAGGLQVLQQLGSALDGVGVLLLAGVWRAGWGGV